MSNFFNFLTQILEFTHRMEMRAHERRMANLDFTSAKLRVASENFFAAATHSPKAGPREVLREAGLAL